MNSTPLKLKILSRTLAHERVFLLPIAGCVLLGTILSVLSPLLYRQVVDRIIERNPQVLTALLKMIIIQTGAILNSWALNLVLARFQYSTVETLRVRTFESVARDRVFGDSVITAGEAYTVIMTDTDRFASFFRQAFPGLLSSSVAFFGTVIGMIYLDLVLLPWAATAVLMQFFLYLYRANITERLSRRSRELSGTLNSTVQELLSKRLDIKAVHGECWAVERFRKALADALTQYKRATSFSINCDALSGSVNAVALVGLFLVGIRRVFASEITFGTLSAFIAYNGRLLQPLLSAWSAIVSWREIKPSLERISALLVNSKAPINCPSSNAGDDVCFHDLSISGGPGRPDRIRNVRGIIPKGKIVGLVGPNGCGKTSLCLALAGLLRPYKGYMNIFGQGIADHNWCETFSNVVIIPQGSDGIFSTTVRENICLDRNVEDTTLHELLRQVMLDDCIAALPRSLDANLTDHLSTLSGGEKQKLLLARAILRNPRLLLLDEALSGIAAEDLDGIFGSLRRNICELGGRVLVVCHNPKVLEHCDLVIQIDRANGAFIPSLEENRGSLRKEE